MVGLEGVDVRSPMPDWTGDYPDHPMWESDKKKLRKHQIDKGIIQPEAESDGDEAAAAQEPDKPLKMYFKRGCPYTRAAEGLLAQREVDYEAIDITDDEVQRSWVKLVTGQSTTPQIFIGGDHIGGFDQLRELDQAGQLGERLEAAQAAIDAEVAKKALPNKGKGINPSIKAKIKLPILHPERSPFEDLDADLGEQIAGGEELEGDELVARVNEVLDECRPMVQADGGDIKLLDVQPKQVSIELTGNCIGCPSAQATLKQGIERRLKNRIPQIESISSPQLQ